MHYEKIRRMLPKPTLSLADSQNDRFLFTNYITAKIFSDYRKKISVSDKEPNEWHINFEKRVWVVLGETSGRGFGPRGEGDEKTSGRGFGWWVRMKEWEGGGGNFYPPSTPTKKLYSKMYWNHTHARGYYYSTRLNPNAKKQKHWKNISNNLTKVSKIFFKNFLPASLLAPQVNLLHYTKFLQNLPEQHKFSYTLVRIYIIVVSQ